MVYVTKCIYCEKDDVNIVLLDLICIADIMFMLADLKQKEK